MTLNRAEIVTGVLIGVVLAIVGAWVGAAWNMYERGESAAVGDAPAVVELKDKVGKLEDELSELKEAHASAAAEASAERAALAQQSNQILSALLNN